MIIRDIKINGIESPIGFELETPILSFKVDETDSKRAKNICVSVKEEKSNSQVFYTEGKELKQSGIALNFQPKPRRKYHCMITVNGDVGDKAEAVAEFETGKMYEKWDAEWITPAGEDNDGRMHPILHKTIEITKSVKHARLYATGVGMFEAYINGKKLGNEFLAPFHSHYETYLQVLTFPVEDLKIGINHWDFLLGKGWYMGRFGMENQVNSFGNCMAAIGELYVEYEDGSEEKFCTDETFVYTASDIKESGIYFGEVIDRTNGKRLADLMKVSFEEWKSVERITAPEENAGTKNLVKEHLRDRISPLLKLHEKIPVQEVIQTPAGETVLDMGQNFAGLIRFYADFEAGTTVELEFGEILQNGNFYNANYRTAESKFVYTSDGNPEIVEPHFTYYGFRYIKISGWPGEINPYDIEGEALYSDMEQTGFFHTQNSKVNQLISNVMWGLKSNFIDLPTDCPQRDERLAWTGDAQVFSPTACYCMDTRAFYHKFTRDLRNEQKILHGAIPHYLPNFGHLEKVSSVWGDVATFLPDILYRMFGNIAQLKENYALMKAWVDYIEAKDQERGAKYLYDFGTHFGDWLALDGISDSSFKGSTEDAYIASMYYARSTEIVMQAAKTLELKEDVIYYQKLYNNIRQAVLDEYFTPAGRLATDTQAAYIIALKFRIYRDRNVILKQFKRRLKMDGYKIKCGFVGAPLLCTVLGEYKESKTSFDFLLNESYPGWLYCVNLGATTIWERWNSVLPDGTISPTGMNSLNHYSYGSVLEFLYAYAVGIRPETEGFEKAIIEPHLDIRLANVECTYDSVSGRYVCNSKILGDGQVTIHVEIPFGCRAKLILPESGKDAIELESGKFDFTYMPFRDYRKPYSEHSRMSELAENEQTMGILFNYIPAFGGIAAEHVPEFECNTLTEMKELGFLPYEPEKYEKAVEELKKVVAI